MRTVTAGAGNEPSLPVLRHTEMLLAGREGNSDNGSGVGRQGWAWARDQNRRKVKRTRGTRSTRFAKEKLVKSVRC